MKRVIIFILLIAAGQNGFGQAKGERKFKLKGKPILTIFANYHAGLGRANGDAGFELDRSYIGYETDITERLSGKVVLDIGPTQAEGAELERVAYVKNAMLRWETDDFTLDFGLISTEQFKTQEKTWRHRYVMKSFQDEYGFGSSADMGILARYQPLDWLSVDATFLNGEGYKKLNADNKYRYGIGATVNPIKEVTLRGYFDNADKNVSEKGTRAQQTLSLFAGYHHKTFSVGAEFNKQYNTDFQKGHDQTGVSAYTVVKLGQRFQAFGRYDNLSSAGDWSDADTQCVVAGLEYAPVKQIKIAPNFRNQNPRSGKANSFIYLNIEFNI